MRWTTRQLRYLEEHADEGAAAIADALGRSVGSVQVQASRRGVSLRRSWHCPKCGLRTHKPLNSRTGWCVVCTMKERREKASREVAEMEEEVRREEAEKKERQKLYSRRARAKKKLKS